MEMIYTDPKELDGTCFEVAGAACRQAESVAALLKQATTDAFKMARLAEMERKIQCDEDPDGPGFVDTPQGKKFIAIENASHRVRIALRKLAQAAEYDPLNPPPETPEALAADD